MADKSVIENIKYDEGQTNLTEAQIQAIADEALKESSGDEKPDGWKNPADAEHKTGQEQREEAQAAEDKKKEDEAKAAEEEQKKADEEAAKTDEQKKAEADAKAIEDKKKADEAAAAGKPDDKTFVTPDRDKAIQDLALKDSLTLEEAEEQIKKDEATINKYKNNPVELAKAVRHFQALADKTKADLEATRKAADNPPVPVLNNVKEYVESQLDPIKDKVIAAFRKEYPELTQGHEDTFVYGLIKKDAMDRTLKVLDENKSKLTNAAKEKRANLILNLSEQEKTYLPDIKAILDRTNDRQLMDKGFDIKDIVYWAKGKQMDKALKDAEDRGFKRGQENPKILGEKTPGSKTPPPSTGSSKKIVLNSEQQQRAQDMFDIIGMTDEDKYQSYIETYPEEFKK